MLRVAYEIFLNDVDVDLGDVMPASASSCIPEKIKQPR